MSKIKKKIPRGVTILLAVLLCTVMSGCRRQYHFSLERLFSSNGKSDYRYEYDHGDRYQSGDGSCDADIRVLDIDWVSGSVEIRTHDKNTVEFYEESDQTIPEEYQMRYMVDGDTLRIKFCASGRWDDWKYLSKHLTVLIPETLALEEIGVDTASAETSIRTVNVKEVEVDTVSGNVNISDMDDLRNAEVDTSSGNVVIKTGDTAESLKIGTVSGSVEITADRLKAFEIETVSGTVRLTVAEDSAGEIESVSANVNILLPETVGYEIDYSSVSGKFGSDLDYEVKNDRYRSGDGGCRIEVETVSGNLNIGTWDH